jgi:RNA polymerase sigma factor (sigma-70 family)
MSAKRQFETRRGRFGERPVMTDRDLLDRFIAQNDPDTFRLLVERHGPMVLAVCRGVLRHQHDVEDAFQNTFLILARRAATIKHHQTVGPWLHRVALRVAQKARGNRSEIAILHDIDLACTQEHRLDSAIDSYSPLLREELNRLPDSYRLPLVLCYLEGKSNREAADQLCWPVGTVKGRLSRARRTLRERLLRRGVGIS